MSAVPRQGNDRTDGRADEVQRHLPAMPWDGQDISPCPVCHGEGSVERTDPLEILIKAGTRDGQRIRIAGKGNAGLRGAVSATSTSSSASASTAFPARGRRHPHHSAGDGSGSGARIEDEVPTIDGRSMLKIPPGTQSGRSRGCAKKACRQRPKDGVRGDEIVEAETLVPCRAMRRRKNAAGVRETEPGRPAGKAVE